MGKRLTQLEFDTAAAAWSTFIDKATPAKVQALFQTGAEATQGRQYQTYVSFDLAATIPYLLSTVGIRQVMARFVLLPATEGGPLLPRFRVVLYAADQLGGRISAYYQSDAVYHTIPPKSTPAPQPPTLVDTAAVGGLVPFSLIRNWLTAWVSATTAQQLSPALFVTSYGPLQGYNFELGDFIDQLFSAPARGATQLYLNFGLKSYFPAYPEVPKEPIQTFGLVVRLYSPGTKTPDEMDDPIGTESGPSYDMSQTFPPG